MSGSRELWREALSTCLQGLCIFAAGGLAGVLAVTLLYLVSPGAESAASGAFAKVASAKVVLLESAGLKTELSIMFSNMLAIVAVMSLPALVYRIEGERRLAYERFPKLLMFAAGALSIGAFSPPLVSPLFPFYLLYLLPHGVLEFSAVALAYTVATSRVPELRNQLAAVSFLLLIPSSVIEVNVSMKFALRMAELLGYFA
ncbi:MAG: hypothetical protein GXN98_03710 [Euryarchaeota archaeon]|nr:hypothetical protein [Euryarchaeota archaeon]